MTRCSEGAESLGEPGDGRHGVSHAASGPDFDLPAPDSSGAGVIEGPVIEGLGAGKSTGLQQRAMGTPPAVLVAGVGVFALGLIAAIAGARREPDLQRGEVVLFQGRPRKSLLHYASSLGLW